MAYPRLAKYNAGIAAAAANSIPGEDLTNASVTVTQLANNAVETAKIKDGAVTPAKKAAVAINSAGVTTAALTAAIADPATLVEGAVYAVKDTADANKIKLVAVRGGAFYVGAALTAAA